MKWSFSSSGIGFETDADAAERGEAFALVRVDAGTGRGEEAETDATVALRALRTIVFPHAGQRARFPIEVEGAFSFFPHEQTTDNKLSPDMPYHPYQEKCF